MLTKEIIKKIGLLAFMLAVLMAPFIPFLIYSYIEPSIITNEKYAFFMWRVCIFITLIISVIIVVKSIKSGQISFKGTLGKKVKSSAFIISLPLLLHMFVYAFFSPILLLSAYYLANKPVSKIFILESISSCGEDADPECSYIKITNEEQSEHWGFYWYEDRAQLKYELTGPSKGGKIYVQGASSFFGIYVQNLEW